MAAKGRVRHTSHRMTGLSWLQQSMGLARFLRKNVDAGSETRFSCSFTSRTSGSGRRFPASSLENRYDIVLLAETIVLEGFPWKDCPKGVWPSGSRYETTCHE